MERARSDLEEYERVYRIFDYCSELHEQIKILEYKITANEPTIPMNIYRWAPDCSVPMLLIQFEEVLNAYYDLFDQCAEYPDWQRKIRKEMGAVVSFIAK